MGRTNFKRLAFRRRRQGVTDYRTRLALLKSRLPRAVVRLTGGKVIVQLIAFTMEGDRVLAGATSNDLTALGWKRSPTNTPAAHLTGLLAGRRALSAGVSRAVLDIGRATPTRGGRVFAVLKGLVDAGLEIPHSEDLYPSPERLAGAHIDAALSDEIAQLTSTIKTGDS